MGITAIPRIRGVGALAAGIVGGSLAIALVPRERSAPPWVAIGATGAIGAGALLGGQLLHGPLAQVVRAAGTGALLAAGTGALLSIGRGGTHGPTTRAVGSLQQSSRRADDATPPTSPSAASVADPVNGSASTPTPSVEPSPPAWSTGTMLAVGDRGPAVAALKQRLAELRYAVDDGDEYTWQTRDAVMAFQKVHGLERDGVAGPLTQAALAEPREPQLGVGPADRVDVDLSDQVLVVVRGGEVDYIVNATTGDPNHPDGMGELTPVGTWSVERKIEGIRDAPLGRIYWPSYFHGGIAVHGSGSILPERASHGCVRVPRSLEERIHRDMPVGSAVVVHE